MRKPKSQVAQQVVRPLLRAAPRLAAGEQDAAVGEGPLLVDHVGCVVPPRRLEERDYEPPAVSASVMSGRFRCAYASPHPGQLLADVVSDFLDLASHARLEPDLLLQGRRQRQQPIRGRRAFNRSENPRRAELSAQDQQVTKGGR